MVELFLGILGGMFIVGGFLVGLVIIVRIIIHEINKNLNN